MAGWRDNSWELNLKEIGAVIQEGGNIDKVNPNRTIAKTHCDQNRKKPQTHVLKQQEKSTTVYIPKEKNKSHIR